MSSTPMQSYGEEPLVAMLAWLRDAARQVGHGDLWRPPLLDSLEAREYTQVRPPGAPHLSAADATVTAHAVLAHLQETL